MKDVFIEGDFINVVMPLMVSDLRKFLDKRLRVNEAQIKCMVLQILSGVAELHRNWFFTSGFSSGKHFYKPRWCL